MVTTTRRRPVGRSVLLFVGKLAIATAVIVLVLRFIRRVDWAQVWSAASRLSWWQVIVVAALVLLLHAVSSTPLVLFVPGLPYRRALSNGLSGTLITTFMPPPSETLLRLAMLRSWRVETTTGAAALALNTVVFYLARFTVPLLGLSAALLIGSVTVAYWTTAGIGVLIACAIVVVLAVISRGERSAARAGRGLGTFAARFRSAVDPQEWADGFVRFQRSSTTDLARRLVRSTGLLWGAIVVDGLIVLACLRFTGLPAGAVPAVAVIAAFLCVFPLTVFPFAGLGVLDAALIGLLNEMAELDQSSLVAGLVVWRAFTLIFPLLPGLLCLTGWRRGAGNDVSRDLAPPTSRTDDGR